MTRSDENSTPLASGGRLSPIEIKSVYETQAQKPLVELKLGEIAVRLEAASALMIGEMLIQTALAARSDAFVFDFARAELGVDELAAALMLQKFRTWRMAQAQDSVVGSNGAPTTSIREDMTADVASYSG